MNLNGVNKFYLNNLYDHDTSTNEVLDLFSSHLFLPHTLQLKRVRSNSKTLIDNKFSNAISPNTASCNLR